MSLRSLASGAVLVLMAAAPAQAALTYHAVVTVATVTHHSPPLGQVVVGDTFWIDITFDETAVDEFDSTYTSFLNPVLDFKMGKINGTGVWDPAGSEWAIASGLWSVPGSGILHSSNMQAMTTPGSANALVYYGENSENSYAPYYELHFGGATLSADSGTLGSMIPDLAALVPSLTMNHGPVQATFTTTSPTLTAGSYLSPVPEPASTLLGLLGGLFLLRRQRC